jgi:uncharacterized repeat protein (TIGR03803 family)
MTKIAYTSETRLRAVSIALALAVVLVPAVVGTKSAEPQTFKVLYKFKGGSDGGHPFAALIRDAAGNLYGTTRYGGAHGFGTVFKLSNAGKETVLYSFARHGDGAYPMADLVRDANGNLYGTTNEGGASGNGILFELDKTGKETVLHSFCSETGCTDGANPQAGLVRDASGNLYGTTSNSGPGYGTVFMLDTSGNETVLYDFGGNSDGANPVADLVRDAAGNLYGTTYYGNSGTVFEVDKDGNHTVLYGFSGGADGGNPAAGLVRDASGNLYGTTRYGGQYDSGTVFELASADRETVLHSFGSQGDGAYSVGGLVRDAAGNLYGTTGWGGAYGYGTVFKLSKAGKETVLHSFAGSDGKFPYAALVRDAKGNLYGTTYAGGASGRGTVFKLTP